MKTNLKRQDWTKMIPAFEQRLKYGSQHAVFHWKRRREGEGRHGPEEKARQQHALP